MPSSIPTELWAIIKNQNHLPRTHIALSQTCQDARQAYNSAGTWRQLCMELGVGRSLGEKQVSWKRVYIEVEYHQRTCRVPSCFRFGVPARDCIGDLLPSLTAAREHYAAQYKPGDGDNDTSQPDSNPEDEDTKASAAAKCPKGKKPPPPEPVVPRLLPLSKAHKDSVPAAPAVHRLLRSCGGTNFTAFVRGRFLGAPRIRHALEERYWRAIDWEQDDDPINDEPLERLDDHPLLARAFATNPPVVELRIRVMLWSKTVKNPTGVTVKDLCKGLSKRMLAKPTEQELHYVLDHLFIEDQLLAMVIDPLGKPQTRVEMVTRVAVGCGW